MWYDTKVNKYNNLEVEFIMVRNILLVVHIIVCVSLILIVILQSGRSAGISGEVAGGAETFFGKNKARTLNGMLGRWTTYAAIIFVITSLGLTIFWNV
jgi:preprotein translocase subunit SecG